MISLIMSPITSMTISEINSRTIFLRVSTVTPGLSRLAIDLGPKQTDVLDLSHEVASQKLSQAARAGLPTLELQEAYHSSVVRDLMRRDDFRGPRRRIADALDWPQTGPAPMHFPVDAASLIVLVRSSSLPPTQLRRQSAEHAR